MLELIFILLNADHIWMEYKKKMFAQNNLGFRIFRFSKSLAVAVGVGDR